MREAFRFGWAVLKVSVAGLIALSFAYGAGQQLGGL